MSENNRVNQPFQEFQQSVLGLAQDYYDSRLSLEKAVMAVLEETSHALGVERLSLWEIRQVDGQESLQCMDLFELSQRRHSRGVVLESGDFPNYFRAMSSARAIIADDAHSHGDTKEFADAYLNPLGITSMLDVPVRWEGKLWGVVCSEHVGTARKWTSSEIYLVTNAADQISMFLSHQNRMSLEETMAGLNRELIKLLDVRTKEIANQQQKLFNSSKLSSLGEMAGGIAHEINNPLAVIQLLVEQLRDDAEKGEVTPETVISASDRIIAVVQRIAKIVRSLRTLSRQGESEVFEQVSVKEWLKDTMALCESRFKSMAVHFTLTLEPQDLKIECLSVPLSQVLLNLLNNAFDAIEPLNMKWIQLAVSKKGEYCEFSVTDSGSGVPKEIQEKIMQPFFTTKEVGRGTGLGLSLSRGIIEKHGGQLTLDQNCPNTSFVVRIPIARVKKQQKVSA